MSVLVREVSSADYGEYLRFIKRVDAERLQVPSGMTLIDFFYFMREQKSLEEWK